MDNPTNGKEAGNNGATPFMADLHNQFGRFDDRIALTVGAKVALQIVQNMIRQRIRSYFQHTLQLQIPEFGSQGACAMDTTVTPLDGEYRIDDGVYLRHLDKQEDRNWSPGPIVHQWLKNAVDDQTGENRIAMDKRTGVRVRYAGQYNINLSVYGELNGQYRLAVKGLAKWLPRDALKLTEWFRSYVNLWGEQLVRIVRYLKAWADFQSMRRGRMPSGLILTILAVNCFHPHERDDVAFAETLKAIANSVSDIVFVLNPVDISEELTARLPDKQKRNFQEAVREAAADGNEAVLMTDNHKASEIWRRQFGDRFPLPDAKEPDYLPLLQRAEGFSVKDEAIISRSRPERPQAPKISATAPIFQFQALRPPFFGYEADMECDRSTIYFWAEPHLISKPAPPRKICTKPNTIKI